MPSDVRGVPDLVAPRCSEGVGVTLAWLPDEEQAARTPLADGTKQSPLPYALITLQFLSGREIGYRRWSTVSDA